MVAGDACALGKKRTATQDRGRTNSAQRRTTAVCVAAAAEHRVEGITARVNQGNVHFRARLTDQEHGGDRTDGQSQKEEPYVEEL